MLELLLSAVLLVPSPVQEAEDDVRPPDPAVVAATVVRLQAAYKAKDVDEILASLEAARAILARKVIKEVAKGLKNRQAKVQEGAIETLRWMAHPDALDALHDAYRRNRPLMKVDDLAFRVLKAIGQHGDATSLKILSDNPFQPNYPKAIQARILGLGMIRTDESLATAIELMNRAGTRSRRGNANRRMNADFRATLTVLTGEDQGANRDEWIKWWNEHKRAFEVPREMPDLPKETRRRWYRYWEIEDPLGPKRKKRDGGGDRGGSEGDEEDA